MKVLITIMSSPLLVETSSSPPSKESTELSSCTARQAQEKPSPCLETIPMISGRTTFKLREALKWGLSTSSIRHQAKAPWVGP